jgi:hypothetical protein
VTWLGIQRYGLCSSGISKLAPLFALCLFQELMQRLGVFPIICLPYDLRDASVELMGKINLLKRNS